MTRTIGMIGMSAGGSLGWWAGAHVGMVTAAMVSAVLSGVGLYAARRWTDGWG